MISSFMLLVVEYGSDHKITHNYTMLGISKASLNGHTEAAASTHPVGWQDGNNTHTAENGCRVKSY